MSTDSTDKKDKPDSHDGGSKDSHDGGSKDSHDGGSKDSHDGGSKDSHDGGSKDDGGSKEDGGSDDDGQTPPSLSAIDSLTNDLNQLKDNGKPDVKLSAAARDQYLHLINTYKTALQAERKKMNGLDAIGNVGLFESANQTKRNLQLDVGGVGGIQQTLDKYIEYLDTLAQTVKQAADRLIHNG